MSTLIAFLIGFNLGLFTGLLVYRKNGKRLVELEAEIRKLRG